MNFETEKKRPEVSKSIAFDQWSFPRSWKVLILIAVVGISGLLLSQCVHVACMTGVACVPYIGPPEWVQKDASDRALGNDHRALIASLNPLQNAIRDGRPVSEIAKIIHDSPEQMNTAAQNGQRALDFAVEAKNPEAIELLLAAGADGFSRQDPPNAWKPATSPFETALREDVSRFNLQDEMDALVSESARFAQEVKRLRDPAAAAAPLLIEPFLASGKLDPESELAQEALRDATSSRVVFNRLLVSGIVPGASPQLAHRLARDGSPENMRAVLKVNPAGKTWLSRDELSIVAAAVDGCKFVMANLLLDAGVAAVAIRSDVIARKSNEYANPFIPDWADRAAKNCNPTGDVWPEGVARRTPEELAARVIFLKRLNGATPT